MTDDAKRPLSAKERREALAEYQLDPWARELLERYETTVLVLERALHAQGTQPPPIDAAPPPMSWDEIETRLNEFGLTTRHPGKHLPLPAPVERDPKVDDPEPFKHIDKKKDHGERYHRFAKWLRHWNARRKKPDDDPADGDDEK